MYPPHQNEPRRLVSALNREPVFRVGEFFEFSQEQAADGGSHWSVDISAYTPSVPDNEIFGCVYQGFGGVIAEINSMMVDSRLHRLGVAARLTSVFMEGCIDLGVDAIRSVSCNLNALRTRRSVYGGQAKHVLDWSEAVSSWGDLMSYDCAIEMILSGQEAFSFSCVVPLTDTITFDPRSVFY